MSTATTTPSPATTPPSRPRPRRGLGKRSRQVWLSAHFLAMGWYLTGILGTVALLLMAPPGTDPVLRLWAHRLGGMFDYFLIIPGSLGTLITGVWLSWRTNWGLAKHWWIIVKLIANVGLMTFGAVVLRTYAHNRLVTRGLAGDAATVATGGDYAGLRAGYLGLTAAAAAVLVAVIYISVVKPWGRAPGWAAAAVAAVLGYTAGMLASFAVFRGPAGPWMLPLSGAGALLGFGYHWLRRRTANAQN